MSDGESIAGREREVTFHTPGALTREQVEDHCNMLADANVDWPGRESLSEALLDHDAALRATITQQAQELQQERDKCDAIRNRFPVDAASWRGVDPDDVCQECDGAGTKTYANTSTFHYSAGGQAMTLSVCDRCWGSGNKFKPWKSWKQQAQEVERLEKEKLAISEHAAKLVGQCCETHLEEVKRMGFPEFVKTHPKGCEWCLQQQLAASQQRVEAFQAGQEEIASALGWANVHPYTKQTFILNQIAHLQATLAERVAEVGELNVKLRDARQDAARLREALQALWRLTENQKIQDFDAHAIIEKALKGA